MILYKAYLKGNKVAALELGHKIYTGSSSFRNDYKLALIMYSLV